jgi:DNA-binding GntR family transcriptional regulator
MQSTEQQLATVVDALEEDIVLGRLRPHQELVEDVLMQRFDIKRHLARAAILDLSAKGLVVKPRNKSARVKDYSPEEVHWIYDVRIVLCTRAIETMRLPGDVALLKELRVTHAAHGFAVAERRLRDVRLYNDRFHDQVFAACANPYLIADIERYNRLSDPIRSTGIASQEWLAQAIRDHAAILDAIEQGDRDSLVRQIVGHMLPVRDAWLTARQLLVFTEPKRMT